jgi:hypothetical protein
MHFPQQTASNHCNDNRAVEAGLPLRGALLSHTLAWNMRTRKEPTKQAMNEPMNETSLDRGKNIPNMYWIQQQEKTVFLDKFVAISSVFGEMVIPPLACDVPFKNCSYGLRYVSF